MRRLKGVADIEFDIVQRLDRKRIFLRGAYRSAGFP
jgi:hypothetical protein